MIRGRFQAKPKPSWSLFSLFFGERFSKVPCIKMAYSLIYVGNSFSLPCVVSYLLFIFVGQLYLPARSKHLQRAVLFTTLSCRNQSVSLATLTLNPSSKLMAPANTRALYSPSDSPAAAPHEANAKGSWRDTRSRGEKLSMINRCIDSRAFHPNTPHWPATQWTSSSGIVSHTQIEQWSRGCADVPNGVFAAVRAWEINLWPRLLHSLVHEGALQQQGRLQTELAAPLLCHPGLPWCLPFYRWCGETEMRKQAVCTVLLSMWVCAAAEVPCVAMCVQRL